MRSYLWIVIPFFTFACGGGSSPAESPQQAHAADPADSAADGTSSAAAASDTDAAGTEDDGWAGENEATNSAESGSAASPSGEAETRTPAVIQSVIKERRAEVRECYDKARKDLPDLKGDMTIHLVLDPEGNVKKAELNLDRSTLKAASVADCAIKVLKSITFPPSSRAMETTVNYPFTFTH